MPNNFKFQKYQEMKWFISLLCGMHDWHQSQNVVWYCLSDQDNVDTGIICPLIRVNKREVSN